MLFGSWKITSGRNVKYLLLKYTDVPYNKDYRFATLFTLYLTV